tara:strand:+ start:164 stop:418 length:255 start_codon:yes stop_codon:yes gene_type:complete
MSKISSITERVTTIKSGLYLTPKEPIDESVQKLLGKSFLYRYHRPNHVYKGRVISIVDNKRIVVMFESGEVMTRYISSFDFKED